MTHPNFGPPPDPPAPGQPGQPAYPPPVQPPQPQPPGSPRRNNAGVTAAVVVLLVMAAGGAAFFFLGGDDKQASETDEGMAYVEAFFASMVDDYPGDDSDVRCLTTALVNELGVGYLRDAGISAEGIRDNPDMSIFDLGVEIDRPQADGIYDSADGCMDFRDYFDAVYENEGLSGDDVDCMNDQLSDADIREIMLGGITTTDEDDDTRAVDNAAATCGVA